MDPKVIRNRLLSRGEDDLAASVEEVTASSKNIVTYVKPHSNHIFRLHCDKNGKVTKATANGASVHGSDGIGCPASKGVKLGMHKNTAHKLLTDEGFIIKPLQGRG